MDYEEKRELVTTPRTFVRYWLSNQDLEEHTDTLVLKNHKHITALDKLEVDYYEFRAELEESRRLFSRESKLTASPLPKEFNVRKLKQALKMEGGLSVQENSPELNQDCSELFSEFLEALGLPQQSLTLFKLPEYKKHESMHFHSLKAMYYGFLAWAARKGTTQHFTQKAVKAEMESRGYIQYGYGHSVNGVHKSGLPYPFESVDAALQDSQKVKQTIESLMHLQKEVD